MNPEDVEESRERIEARSAIKDHIAEAALLARHLRDKQPAVSRSRDLWQSLLLALDEAGDAVPSETSLWS
jgi:hypothetical protein